MSLKGAGEPLKEQLREDRHKKVVELLRPPELLKKKYDLKIKY